MSLGSRRPWVVLWGRGWLIEGGGVCRSASVHSGSPWSCTAMGSRATLIVIYPACCGDAAQAICCLRSVLHSVVFTRRRPFVCAGNGVRDQGSFIMAPTVVCARAPRKRVA